jgi:phospholipid/cholesterol/gamma-HCH transport system permease protein
MISEAQSTTGEADGWAFDAGAGTLNLSGRWSLDHMTVRERQVQQGVPALLGNRGEAATGTLHINLAEVLALDTFGAALLLRLQKALGEKGMEVSFDGLPEHSRELFERVEGAAGEERPERAPTFNALVRLILRLGAGTREAAAEAKRLLTFFGMIMRVLGRVLLHPSRIRRHALMQQMEETGLNSLPIVGLLSLLIGMVLAYLSAVQLKNFGAEILVVNIVGLAVLREIGVLLAAIILAGRSGSAFTAQIGTMKVNQEVDAMQTIGLDVVEVLVLPRILGLVLTLPLVSFYGAMAGLLGGGLAGYFLLDITPGIFLQQLKMAVGSNDLLVTFIKAPVFAFAIAMVGCFQGLRVSGSAQSVGEMTTKSVVVSICLVILIDAFFSILFQELGI